MAKVVGGLDAAHRAVGLPGSSHTEAALARGHDLLVLRDHRIVEVGVVQLHEEGRGLRSDRSGALGCLDRRGRGEHPRGTDRERAKSSASMERMMYF